MIVDWRSACVLTLTEFEVAWERAGHEETPWQLDPPRAAMTTDDRDRLVATTLEGLAARGLGNGRHPGRFLTHRFACLAAPDAVVDMRARTGRSLLACVAAQRGGRCVLAARSGNEIALADLHPHSAIPALVELLGPVPPGRCRHVSVPARAVAATRDVGDDPARFVAALTRHGVRPVDAEAVHHACRGVDQRAQFGASRSRGDGLRIRRGPYVVGTHRGDQGQVQVVPTGHGDVAIGPATRESLAWEIDRLSGLV